MPSLQNKLYVGILCMHAYIFVDCSGGSCGDAVEDGVVVDSGAGVVVCYLCCGLC